MSCNNQLATYNKPFPVNSHIKDIRSDYRSLGLFHTQTHNASPIRAPAFSIGNTSKNSSPNCFLKNFVIHNFSWRDAAMNLLCLVAENMSNPKYSPNSQMNFKATLSQLATIFQACWKWDIFNSWTRNEKGTPPSLHSQDH